MNRMTRGVVLVAIGVAIGVLVLASTVDESGPSASQATTTTEATTTTGGNGTPTSSSVLVVPDTTSPTTPTTLAEAPVFDPAVVRVQVFNATDVSGAASRITSELTVAGYVSLPAGNAPDEYQDRSQSYIYYTQGYLGNAQAITIQLELSQSSLRPVPPDFVIQTDGAHIAVAIGNDSLSTRGQ